MENKALIEKISKEFKIDIMDDYVSKDVNDIVFCFDWSKSVEAKVLFLRGDAKILGFKNPDDLYIRDFLSMIEINNPISEVYGRENYINGIKNDLSTLKKIDEFYLPLRDEDEVLWICLSIKAITKNDGSNELIYGHVNWVTSKTPRAILYYKNKYKDNHTKLFTNESLKLHLNLARPTDHSYGLFFDIDNFKRINDVFGHRAGDNYLTLLADKLIANYEEGVIYYRMGGDEFFVYLVNCTEEVAYKKALDIIYTVETLNPQGQQVEVSASVGIIPIIGNDLDYDEVFELADKTMYFSKRKGKGNISYAREV
ncbi:MAG: GGDEF domain-containing protein [Tenericutes bacterium]|nr:GGDEF domain-containing protein [Mycoplasmatota bacterium]